jgi:nitrogenase molybdenum-iron protein alpha chain
MSKLTENLTYDYLSAEAAPTREERIEAIYAFGGSCSSLKHGMGKAALSIIAENLPKVVAAN